MSSLLFYLIIALVIISVIFLVYYQRREASKFQIRKKTPNFASPEFTRIDIKEQPNSLGSNDIETSSPYDPNLIVLQISAFPGKPYMGYELHQAILSSGLRFGEKNIFHRYDNEKNGKVLFSLAAATANGAFAIEDMGSFKCNGLLLFMYLDAKQKLMANFDLMLDTARQLSEELGGEICDDLKQLINADVIKRLREKICTVETSNLYVSDLLDNLD